MIEYWKSNNPLTPVLPLFLFQEVCQYDANATAELKAALSATLGLNEALIMPDNGSTAVIEKVLSKPYTQVVLAEMDFYMFDTLCTAYNQKVKKFNRDHFTKNLSELLRGLSGHTLVMFSMINNYDDKVITVEEIMAVAALYPGVDFVVDGAYFEYSCMSYSVLEPLYTLDNVFYIGTMSKGYALAGFRVGYLLGDVKRFYPLEVPYKISSVSAKVASYSLRNPQFLRQTHQHLVREKELLLLAGFKTGQAHRFLYLGDADGFYNYLESRSLHCSKIDYGNKKALSFSVQKSDENAILIEHLKRFQSLG